MAKKCSFDTREDGSDTVLTCLVHGDIETFTIDDKESEKSYNQVILRAKMFHRMDYEGE